MPSQIDATEIDLIKDFLKEKGYFSTLECFIKDAFFYNGQLIAYTLSEE